MCTHRPTCARLRRGGVRAKVSKSQSGIASALTCVKTVARLRHAAEALTLEEVGGAHCTGETVIEILRRVIQFALIIYSYPPPTTYSDLVGGALGKAAMIIDAENLECECVWDEALEPVGEGTPVKETFSSWCDRYKSRLGNLHPEIAEQWIYRHWTKSPFKNLPLERLRWRLEEWKTSKILSDIHIRDGFGPFSPDWDFKRFGTVETEPFKSLRSTGSWKCPIIIIDAPDGVRDRGEHIPNVRYCLIEGHQRMCYLNALAAHSRVASSHRVFVLTLV